MNPYRYGKNLDSYYILSCFVVYMTPVTIYIAIANLFSRTFKNLQLKYFDNKSLHNN